MSDKNHYVNRKFKIPNYIFEIQKPKLTNLISHNRGRKRQFFEHLYSGKKRPKMEYTKIKGKYKMPDIIHLCIPKL